MAWNGYKCKVEIPKLKTFEWGRVKSSREDTEVQGLIPAIGTFSSLCFNHWCQRYQLFANTEISIKLYFSAILVSKIFKIEAQEEKNWLGSFDNILQICVIATVTSKCKQTYKFLEHFSLSLLKEALKQSNIFEFVSSDWELKQFYFTRKIYL